MDIDSKLFGSDLFGEPMTPPKGGPLAERFEFPPFSVLNAREGDWQNRKRAWIGLGIQSELGRGGGANSVSKQTPELAGGFENHPAQKAMFAQTFGSGTPGTLGKAYNKAAPRGVAMPATNYANRERGSGSGSAIPGTSATSISSRIAPGGGGGGCWLGGPQTASSEAFDNNAPNTANGTSIFDPVLAELCYRWFCPEGGQIVDPFAGGSVRGLVAGLLGFKYHGIDLRAEQIEANREQLTIAPGAAIEWVCGDSTEKMDDAPPADFIFSCPPYGDLERYSDDPLDLSTMEYHTFLPSYKRIIMRCAKKLKDNRLACFVVGDFRDPKNGMYRGFVADTINAFREQGMHLYNDAILVTAVGSLPIRVSGQFESGRKLGKTHQNVLVFAKGDPRKAFK